MPVIIADRVLHLADTLITGEPCTVCPYPTYIAWIPDAAECLYEAVVAMDGLREIDGED